MAGCPPTSGPVAILPGLWIFNVSNTVGGTDVAGLTILAGGATEIPSPPPAGTTDEFSGSLTWMQTGSTFVLDQVVTTNNELRYTGTVQSATQMSGTWERTAGGVGNGTWSASRSN
jgi:hypothetical protein